MFRVLNGLVNRFVICRKTSLFTRRVHSNAGKNFESSLVSWLKRMAMTKTNFIICSGVVAFIGIDAMFAGYIEKNRIPRVVKKFEIGSRYLQIPNEEDFFPRDKETTDIRQLITPSTPGFFNLITGEHGTGKTTLVCHTSKYTPDGVLYFRIPDNPSNFPRTLGKEVNFDFEVHISFWSQLRRRFFNNEVLFHPSELDLVLNGISLASQCYAAKHKRTAIMFIDNLTILTKKDMQTFEHLVRFAKTEADAKNLVINFVASEGHTPRQLTELSESSRLLSVVEIGDLDEKQTIKFISQYGIDKTTARGIFDVAGGRITLLKEAQLRVQRGQTLKEIKESFIQRAQQEFGDLILPEDPSKITPKQKEAWKQIIKIYDNPNKEIPYINFHQAIGSASLVDDLLLQKNVFAYHHGKNTVSLQSHPVELFVATQIGVPDSDHRKKLQSYGLKG